MNDFSGGLPLPPVPAQDSRSGQYRPRSSYETLLESEGVAAALKELPFRFRLGSAGLLELIEPRKGEFEYERLSAPLVVVAVACTTQGLGWSKIVRFINHDGMIRELMISDADLMGKTSRILTQLADLGFEISTGKRERQAFVDLLRKWRPSLRMTLVDRIGWTDSGCSAFVLADGSVIGNDKVRLSRGLAGVSRHPAAARGTVKGWRDNVASLCPGNPLMVTAVSLGFAAPLLQMLGLEGSGLHLYGGTSNGKTTLQHLAYSVWHDTRSLPTWNATRAGLEDLAALHSGTLLALNEIAEADPATIGETVYALTNGRRKQRFGSSTSHQSMETWSLCTISSGEVTLAEHMAKGRGRLMGGHEVRMLQVRADRQLHGVFDEIHGMSSPSEFAEEIRRRADTNHGTAGPAFVQQLILNLRNPDTLRKLRSTLDKITSRLHSTHRLPRDGKTGRAVRHFAVVALAGELACQFDVTGWKKGEALAAVSKVLGLWATETDILGVPVVASAAQRIDAFVSNNAARFSLLDRSLPASADVDAGWIDKERIYVQPKAWAEIHSGHDDRQVAREMQRHGILVVNNGNGLTWRMPRTAAGRPHVYAIDRAKLRHMLRANGG